MTVLKPVDPRRDLIRFNRVVRRGKTLAYIQRHNPRLFAAIVAAHRKRN